MRTKYKITLMHFTKQNSKIFIYLNQVRVRMLMLWQLKEAIIKRVLTTMKLLEMKSRLDQCRLLLRMINLSRALIKIRKQKTMNNKIVPLCIIKEIH